VVAMVSANMGEKSMSAKSVAALVSAHMEG